MPKPATVLLPLQITVDGNTREVPQATMAEIHKAKGEAVPAGWSDKAVVKVEYTGSLDWRKPRRGGGQANKTISKLIVDGEPYTLRPPAKTAMGNGKKHVLPVTRMDFLPKGEKPKIKLKSEYGTGGNGGWLQGSGNHGPKLRQVFENPEATKGELMAVADQYVKPSDPKYNVKDGYVLVRCVVAGRRLAENLHYGCVGPTDAVARRDAKIQALGNALSWREADNIDEDEIYKRMAHVCPEIQEATKRSLAKKPYKGKKGLGRLDKFTVTVLTDKDKDIMDEYAKECADLNRVPRVGGVKDLSRSYAGADGREGRKNHEEVRLSVERALQLCAVDSAVRDAVDAWV